MPRDGPGVGLDLKVESYIEETKKRLEAEEKSKQLKEEKARAKAQAKENAGADAEAKAKDQLNPVRKKKPGKRIRSRGQNTRNRNEACRPVNHPLLIIYLAEGELVLVV